MRRWGISDLNLTERRVLLLLRTASHPGSAPGDGVAPMAADLAILRDELDALSVSLPAAGAHWVSHDELVVLTWLATLQRCNGALPVALPAGLLLALHRCAARLNDAAILLPHRTIARFASLSEAAGAGRLLDAAKPVPRKAQAIRRPPKPDVRGRALALLCDKAIVSSNDFVASGIPLQLVNSLCRQGLIERIYAGWFRPGRQFLQGEMA